MEGFTVGDLIKVLFGLIGLIGGVVGWIIKIQNRFNNLEKDLELNNKLDEEHKTGLKTFISSVENHLKEFKNELKAQSKAIASLEKDYAVLSERSKNETR